MLFSLLGACGGVKLPLPGPAEPRAAGRVAAASEVLPSGRLEWVSSLDGTSKAILSFISFNAGDSTDCSAALQGSAEDLGLREKAAPEAGRGLLCGRLCPFPVLVLK